MKDDYQNIVNNVVEATDNLPALIATGGLGEYDQKVLDTDTALIAYYPWSNIFTFSVFVSFFLLIVLALIRQMKNELDSTTNELGKVIQERTELERFHYDNKKKLQQTQRELLNSKSFNIELKAELTQIKKSLKQKEKELAELYLLKTNTNSDSGISLDSSNNNSNISLSGGIHQLQTASVC